VEGGAKGADSTKMVADTKKELKKKVDANEELSAQGKRILKQAIQGIGAVRREAIQRQYNDKLKRVLMDHPNHRNHKNATERPISPRRPTKTSRPRHATDRDLVGNVQITEHRKNKFKDCVFRESLQTRKEYSLQDITYSKRMTRAQIQGLSRYLKNNGVSTPQDVLSHEGLDAASKVMCRWPRPKELAMLLDELSETNTVPNDLRTYYSGMLTVRADRPSMARLVGHLGASFTEITAEHNLLYIWSRDTKNSSSKQKGDGAEVVTKQVYVYGMEKGNVLDALETIAKRVVELNTELQIVLFERKGRVTERVLSQDEEFVMRKKREDFFDKFSEEVEVIDDESFRGQRSIHNVDVDPGNVNPEGDDVDYDMKLASSSSNSKYFRHEHERALNEIMRAKNNSSRSEAEIAQNTVFNNPDPLRNRAWANVVEEEEEEEEERRRAGVKGGRTSRTKSGITRRVAPKTRI
jgi:hypothetical protein